MLEDIQHSPLQFMIEKNAQSRRGKDLKGENIGRVSNDAEDVICITGFIYSLLGI